ncbi:MAG: hypothetical protein VB086_05270 [Clostridiaceae bacterium]|nr:hypothetical protein [Clostridiaceae bacterium]
MGAETASEKHRCRYFWPSIVGEATGGRYTVLENQPDVIYDDGTPARVLLFDV